MLIDGILFIAAALLQSALFGMLLKEDKITESRISAFMAISAAVLGAVLIRVAP